jgi:hypothetical protein
MRPSSVAQKTQRRRKRFAVGLDVSVVAGEATPESCEVQVNEDDNRYSTHSTLNGLESKPSCNLTITA